MAYLNTRYGGDLSVLWVDAHPDVVTPKELPTHRCSEHFLAEEIRTWWARSIRRFNYRM
jgi:arginase family enzyme